MSRRRTNEALNRTPSMVRLSGITLVDDPQLSGRRSPDVVDINELDRLMPPCPVCDQVLDFTTPGWKRHVQKHIFPWERDVELRCHTCPFVAERRSKLLRHVDNHDLDLMWPSTGYLCAVMFDYDSPAEWPWACREIFNTRSLLDQHREQVHSLFAVGETEVYQGESMLTVNFCTLSEYTEFWEEVPPYGAPSNQPLVFPPQRTYLDAGEASALIEVMEQYYAAPLSTSSSPSHRGHLTDGLDDRASSSASTHYGSHSEWRYSYEPSRPIVPRTSSSGHRHRKRNVRRSRHFAAGPKWRAWARYTGVGAGIALQGTIRFASQFATTFFLMFGS